ncbi:MAG: hypothetical protein RBU28_08600 [Bacteroidales bacterium]|jgi:hypothetical protein|nr:hypothetical protein [Bacteroidales bacterium]
MALTKREVQKLLNQCNKLDDGPDYRINDYVSNLMNTVLDFQMKDGPIGSAMEYYEKNHGYRTHKKLKTFIDSFPETKKGNLQLANTMWNNNHWSRAKFLRMLLNEFEDRGITGQQSLKIWISKAAFEKDIKGQFKTEEHSIGIAIFQWLRLRLGVNTVKPDVHIMNFVTSAVGRKVSQKEAVDALITVAEQTNRKASLLDAAIWNYQKKMPRKV